MLTLMLRQTFLRLAVAVPTLLLVTLGSFALLNSIGDPAAAIAGENATPERLAEINAEYGFDRPLLVQYWDWLTGLLTGDLGSSMLNKGEVGHVIGQYLIPTLLLCALAMGIATGVSLILGTIVGLRPHGLLDRITQFVSVLGIAVPNFLVGLVLILVFAIWWPLLPPGGYRPPASVGLAGTLEYLILPALALALSLMCLQTRTFRASLLTEYESDYVRTARMKGASSWGIFLRHVGRNASAPLVTVIGLEVGVVVTGALVVEVVFGIPGIGTLTIDSVRGQDFPVVQVLVTLFGAIVLSANLIADLVALWVSPVARSAA